MAYGSLSVGISDFAEIKLLLTGIKGFGIRSNREGGKGRSDLVVKPIRRSREAFVVEFKVAKDIDDMASKAEEALRQIAEKQYDVELRNDGYKYVSCYGIAFCGKECVVHCRPCAGVAQ